MDDTYDRGDDEQGAEKKAKRRSALDEEETGERKIELHRRTSEGSKGSTRGGDRTNGVKEPNRRESGRLPRPGYGHEQGGPEPRGRVDRLGVTRDSYSSTSPSPSPRHNNSASGSSSPQERGRRSSSSIPESEASPAYEYTIPLVFRCPICGVSYIRYSTRY